MKYLIAALVMTTLAVHISSQNDAMDNKLLAYSTDCAKSLSISLDEHGRYRPSNLISATENKRKAQCFSKCISEKIGIFNENEGFNVDAYIKTLDKVPNETKIRQNFEKCDKENPRNSDNICQWYFDVLDCIHKSE